MTPSKHELNETAYRRLKESIRQRFPAGHFVAIADGQIIADAGSLADLVAAAARLGRRPADILAVEAGVEYPETGVILCTAAFA
jgi:hypothetical protein